MKINLDKNKKGRDSKGRFIPGFRHLQESKDKIKKNSAKHWLGKKRPDIAKNPKVILNAFNLGKSNLGIKRSEETKNKLRQLTGEKNSRYLKDRTQLKRTDKENSPAHKDWADHCKERDGKQCKMKNKDCCGQLEVHHILAFRSYPELRYDINNGITLCHFHHPRKYSEEERLSPYFQELIKQNG